MIRVTVTGDTKKTESFLDAMITGVPYRGLESLAQEGVNALKAATPIDEGDTASQWSYEIVRYGDSFAIYWKNGNDVDGFNVAAGLRYGHATKNGGWVKGQDYIEPALKPIFDKIMTRVWRGVQTS